MPYRAAVPALLLVLLLAVVTYAGDKGTARLEPIGDVSLGRLGASGSMVTAAACTVSVNNGAAYYIEDWAVGFEWYKALIDPSSGCNNPYPFTIHAINMPMLFTGGTDLTVSVDIETIDYTTIPGCATPGEMITFSEDWPLEVPSEGGGFNIWVELDTPVTVDGPFFAGFYIANQLAAPASVYCDSFPVSCVTYNAWDEEIGWVDLVSGEPAFPGRLVMEVAGMTGDSTGGGEDPPDTTGTDDASAISLIAPQNGDLLLGPTEVWAFDTVFSGAIEYVSFAFSSGGTFAEFGRDYSGETSLRNGVASAVHREGFSVEWDFTYLPEGTYSLRAMAVDTSGDSSLSVIDVTLEPTPPVPVIASPLNGEPFCDTVIINMSCSDEDLSYIELYRKDFEEIHSVGLTPLVQTMLGDTDGDPRDGNPVADGEYGEYCSGPAAAAMAARVWYDRGYEAIMKDGVAFLTLAELGENLVDAFSIEEHNGTYDDALIGGLQRYFENHGDVLRIDYHRNPSYFDVRAAVEDEERTAVLGIGGKTGLWVALDGFLGWIQADSTYKVAVANPVSGGIQVVSFRNRLGYSEIALDAGWQPVDVMVTMVARDWTVTRPLIGVDLDGDNGWSFSWEADGLPTGAVCAVRAIGRDGAGQSGSDVFMGEHNCSLVFVPGDYDNDRKVNIADMFRLIDYIAAGTNEPHGGGHRADANCDNVVNIADIVYFMNFLFGAVGEPCR